MIKADHAIVVDHRRIVGQVAQIRRAVRVFYKSIILIPSRRCVTDGYANGGVVGVGTVSKTAAETIIQIVAAVVSPHNIRGVEVSEALF